jgi:hypothetical protein
MLNNIQPPSGQPGLKLINELLLTAQKIISLFINPNSISFIHPFTYLVSLPHEQKRQSFDGDERRYR